MLVLRHTGARSSSWSAGSSNGSSVEPPTTTLELNYSTSVWARFRAEGK